MIYYIKHSIENKYFTFNLHKQCSLFLVCLQYYLDYTNCSFTEKERLIAEKWKTLFETLYVKKSGVNYTRKAGDLGQLSCFDYVAFMPQGFDLNNNKSSCRIDESQVKKLQNSLSTIIEYFKITEQLKKTIKKYFNKSYRYETLEYWLSDLNVPFSKATLKELTLLEKNFQVVEVNFSTDFLSTTAYVSYVKESYGQQKEGFYSRKNSYGANVLSNISQAKLYDSIEILKHEIGHLDGSILEVHVEVKKVITNQNNNANLEKAVAILEKEKLEKLLEHYSDDEIKKTFEQVQKKRNKI